MHPQNSCKMFLTSIFLVSLCTGLSYGVLHDYYTGKPVLGDLLDFYEKNGLKDTCTINIEPCDPHEWRRVDGSRNNLKNPAVGTYFSPMVRILPPRFLNGVIVAVKAVRSAVQLINDVTTLVTGMDGLIKLINNDKTNERFQENVTKQLGEIHKVCTGIDEVKGKIDDLSDEMKQNHDHVISSIEFNSAKRIVGDFKKNVDYVNTIYFYRFTPVWDNIEHYSPEIIADHAEGIVNDRTFARALSEMLSDINSAPESQSSIFSAMSKFYLTENGYVFRCENISPLDDLHIFYSNVVATFTRSYAALLACYEFLKMQPAYHEFYQYRQDTAFKNFKEAIDAINEHAKIDFDLIDNSNFRASYSCNPEEWVEGENFIRVKNYVSRQFTTYDFPNMDNDQPTTDAENSMEYDCQSQYAIYKSAPYDTMSYVCTAPFRPDLAYPNSVKYGELDPVLDRVWNSKTCIGGDRSDFITLCYEDHNSDPLLSIRKLSLRLQECDTSKNEVVTDAKFYEQGNKIHISLECGVLTDGTVDLDSLRWTTDNEPFSETDYVVLRTTLKSFNLDNVVVPNGELVTGAGFKVVDDHYISLVVKANKVNNYYNGNTFGDSNLHSAPESDESRKLIDITHLERPPTEMEQTHDMGGTPGETYISLTRSAYSPKYHNLAIVPYFDMTQYAAETNAPLGGLGLFYKSLPHYTGFLAFKHLSPAYVQFEDTDETE